MTTCSVGVVAQKAAWFSSGCLSADSGFYGIKPLDTTMDSVPRVLAKCPA